MSALRICIDARRITGRAGGVEQFVIGLASGLSKLSDGNEEYLFLTFAEQEDWIRPYVHGPCRILRGSAVPRLVRWKLRVGRLLPTVRDIWHKLGSPSWRASDSLPRSDGTIERAGIEVMHFTFQSAFLTDVPSIYHPWDLQDLHLPQFFSPRQRAGREVSYRAFCKQARMVCVAATWVKADLVKHYHLPEEKIQVVPAASVLEAYAAPRPEDLQAVRSKLHLPETFAFYPAQTWAHKNHLGLLEALALLRSRHGLRIPFVSSGRLNEFFRKIERQARRLRLTDQVRFLGFVSPLELQCLYKLCRCMVFPSKFEGFGLPLLEAFVAGVPTACSNVTCLPELAGDAALLFDPDKPEEIAEALRRLWTDEALRRTLIERGARNAARFSWERTARTFRAHYRRLAGRTLTEEDRALLEAPLVSRRG